jgi:hypothetical protein
MQEKTIRLCYRKVIDINNIKTWDRYVFEDTYTELLLQAQYFNKEKKYATFQELVTHVPDAENLHFLVSSAIIGYLRQLNGIMPDITSALGNLFLPFDNYRFEILASDLKDRSKHKVAILFYSEPLTWHETVDNQLLVSIPGNMDNEVTLTEMFSLQPYLSIYSIKL